MIIMRASLWQTAGPWPHLPWLSWLPALQDSAQSAAAAAQPAHKDDILLHWVQVMPAGHALHEQAA